MDDFKGYLLNRILMMQTKKEKEHVAPSHVLFKDLTIAIRRDTARYLNELYKEGRIKVSVTLNDKAISVVTKE